MNFETNYICSPDLPKSKVKKRYFERSLYAHILLFESGEYFVHKLSTGVYFPCKSYSEALGMRKLVVDRCGNIDAAFNGRG